MGRTSDAGEKIRAAAEQLIELRGYSALGVAEICEAAGVPKGSFYYFFKSKEALALAVIDEHWAAERRGWIQALTSDAEPLHRLRLLFEATQADLVAGQQSCGTISGCMFGNLTLELSNQTEPIRERLQQIFNEQAAMVDKVIAEAVERGDATVTNTSEAARSIVALIEGQVLLAKLYNDTRLLDNLWTNAAALVGAARAREAVALAE